MGGTPLPPFTDFSPKIFLQKGLKIVFFAQKTPDFGPKNRLRIWGVPNDSTGLIIENQFNFVAACTKGSFIHLFLFFTLQLSFF